MRTLALRKAARARLVPTLFADRAPLRPVLAAEANSTVATLRAALAVVRRERLERRSVAKVCGAYMGGRKGGEGGAVGRRTRARSRAARQQK